MQNEDKRVPTHRCNGIKTNTDGLRTIRKNANHKTHTLFINSVHFTGDGETKMFMAWDVVLVLDLSCRFAHAEINC